METLNLHQYIKVLTARRARGLPVVDSTLAIAHPLVGKQIINQETGKVYQVEKACRHWLWGNYIGLLIQCNGSHNFIWWENETSGQATVLNAIARNQELYSVLDWDASILTQYPGTKR